MGFFPVAIVLRICKIWDSEYPWDVRVEKVALALTTAGHEVHLVARNRDRRLQRERLPEADVHRLEPWRVLGERFDAASSFPAFFNPRWIRAILRTARATSADLIIVRDLPLAPCAIWAARRLKVPVMLDMAENYPAMTRSTWETDAHGTFDWLLRNPRLVEAVEQWALPRLDHTLVVVEESRDRLLALGVEESRVTVVGNTPPLERLDRTPPRVHTNGLPLELVYLGLLEAPRGIGNLIEGVVRARRDGIAVNLTIIGSGREEQDFRRQALATGLGPDVIRFVGRFANAEALLLLQHADVGVVPHRVDESWNTSIPNKLFDYMAAGLAVLTSNTGPASRVVRETNAGLVYADRDADDLARAMARLTDPVLRAFYGRCGRDAIATRFNWQADSARLLEAVERASARGPG